MAKVVCSMDTDTMEASITKDGNPIEHDNFSAQSYFEDDWENGQPTQCCSFAHSKKMSDGTINSTYGTFKVGKKDSYSQSSFAKNILRPIIEAAKTLKASISLNNLFSGK